MSGQCLGRPGPASGTVAVAAMMAVDGRADSLFRRYSDIGAPLSWARPGPGRIPPGRPAYWEPGHPRGLAQCPGPAPASGRGPRRRLGLGVSAHQGHCHCRLGETLTQSRLRVGIGTGQGTAGPAPGHARASHRGGGWATSQVRAGSESVCARYNAQPTSSEAHPPPHRSETHATSVGKLPRATAVWGPIRAQIAAL